MNTLDVSEYRRRLFSIGTLLLTFIVYLLTIGNLQTVKPLIMLHNLQLTTQLVLKTST